jgi:hypothetical protein
MLRFSPALAARPFLRYWPGWSGSGFALALTALLRGDEPRHGLEAIPG